MPKNKENYPITKEARKKLKKEVAKTDYNKLKYKKKSDSGPRHARKLDKIAYGRTFKTQEEKDDFLDAIRTPDFDRVNIK